MEALLLTTDVQNDLRAILAAVHDLEGPVLAIFNNLALGKSSTDQPFRVIDRICGVSGGLVESCGADDDLVFGLEGDN